MQRHAHAMVSHPVLWKIVRSNLFASLAGTDLCFSGLSDFRVLLFPLGIDDPGSERTHGLIAILQLRTLVLATHDHTGGNMGDAHGGFGRVHTLTAGA